MSYIKYPRTLHLPWSIGATRDDRILEDTSQFEGKQVVVTVKMDGENSSLYRDYYHARSLSVPSHPSQNWLKNFHSQIAHNIPEGWRFCCENMFAKHTIHYKDLESYAYLFSVWNENNECLSWAETEEWAELIGLPTVPVLYEGMWEESKILGIYKPEFNGNECEGYVVRVSQSFHYREFRQNLAKFVRKGHVGEAAHHWRTGPVTPNLLKGKSDG